MPNYSYNVSNELTSNSNGSYTYDNNGNTLRNFYLVDFTWDFENRLSPGHCARHEWWYDYIKV